jgi:hypothetical protein
MYVGCSGNNRVCMWVVVGTIRCTSMYNLFWVGTGPYRLTGDVNRLYRWSTTDLWAEDISRILLRFGFLICMVIGEQGCSQFW